jgi:hypothetical protein
MSDEIGVDNLTIDDLVPLQVAKVHSIQNDLTAILVSMQSVEIKLMDLRDKKEEMNSLEHPHQKVKQSRSKEEEDNERNGTKQKEHVPFINVVDKLCLRDMANELNGRIKSILHFIDDITDDSSKPIVVDQDIPHVNKVSENDYTYYYYYLYDYDYDYYTLPLYTLTTELHNIHHGSS